MSGDIPIEIPSLLVNCTELKLCSEDYLNHNLTIGAKALPDFLMEDTGVQLIVNETPPKEVLQINSDPDLEFETLPAINNGQIGNQTGNDEGILQEIIPTNFSTEEQLSSEASCQVNNTLPSSSGNQLPTTTSPTFPLTSIDNDSKTSQETHILPEIFTQLISHDGNLEDSSLPCTQVSQIQTNFPQKVPLKTSATHIETIDTSTFREIDETEKKHGECSPIQTYDTPVDAPEAEGGESIRDDASSNISYESTLVSHISKNMDESETHNLPISSTAFPPDSNDNVWDDDDNGSKELLEENGSSQSNPEELALTQLQTLQNVFENAKCKVDETGKRTENKSSWMSNKTRKSSKSPIRFVEVRERKTTVELKSKDGKPLSPYLCKIFPIHEEKKKVSKNSPAASNSHSHHEGGTKFVVDSRQNKLLDGELTRAVEREKRQLIELMRDYFTRKNLTPIDDNIAIGSPPETYMSWIINDKNKHSDKCWNPLGNILRKTTSTQASQQVNFADKEQLTTFDDFPVVEKDQVDKLCLLGQPQNIQNVARRMYESVQTLQRALHLSDHLCFRDTREMAIGETFRQPGFQEFSESTNELEILKNTLQLMDICRGGIEGYLDTLHNATVVCQTGNRLTKIDHLYQNPWIGRQQVDSGGGGEAAQVSENASLTAVAGSTSSSLSSSQAEELNAQIVQLSRNHILPEVHTFLETQTKVSLSSYYNNSQSLIQTVLCNGHRYKIHFTTSDPAGPIQGILKAESEYVGQPSEMTLEILLNVIHRCSNYIDTRIACSCVWARQSKRYLLEYLEKYLEKHYCPSSDLSRWKLNRMTKKLRKINVFASIVRSFSEELGEAILKLHFCMQKSLHLLDKLKRPQIPGFSSTDFTQFEEVNLGSDNEENYSCRSRSRSAEITCGLSGATLYEKHRNNTNEVVCAETLMKILAVAMKDIELVCDNGKEYLKNVKMPRECRRVLGFVNTTSSQLGLTKDVQFGSLIGVYISATEKLSIFEDFVCEQRTDIRAKIHKLATKIVRNLHDLRGILVIQQSWSTNLSKNSFMRLKEVNEIQRLRKIKKRDSYIKEKMELLRGSDQSLRDAIW